MAEGDSPSCLKKLDQQLLLFVDLTDVFHRRTGTFVCPTRNRAPEVTGKNGVGHLVWQDGVENALARSLDVHPPPVNMSVVKYKTRRTASA